MREDYVIELLDLVLKVVAAIGVAGLIWLFIILFYMSLVASPTCEQAGYDESLYEPLMTFYCVEYNYDKIPLEEITDGK